jgi:hypothetical protein
MRTGAAAQKETPVDVIAELLPTGTGVDVRFQSRAIVRGPRKLLLSLRNRARDEVPEAYDLSADPQERNPNPVASQAWQDHLLAALNERSTALARTAGREAETVTIDATTRDRLHALGYGD